VELVWLVPDTADTQTISELPECVNQRGFDFRSEGVWLYSPLTTCHPVVNRTAA